MHIMWTPLSGTSTSRPSRDVGQRHDLVGRELPVHHEVRALGRPNAVGGSRADLVDHRLGQPHAEVARVDRGQAAAERFTALQTNEIDVLIRNTTWTLTRDSELGADFGPTTYYDGQGFLVGADSGIASVDDMGGATVCVLAGTTTELNLADEFAARGLDYEPLLFDDSNDTSAAYQEGRCDALTSDQSQLAGLRSNFDDPGAHVVLSEVISKEPLGPVVAHGDQQWLDVVSWVVNGTIIAEELGVDSGNVADMAGSDPANPNVRRLLGLQDDMGVKLGLENDFMVNVIGEIGNYGEIYDRHLTPIGLDRAGSNNALWSQGGVLYAPPMR